jgi:hypothetical protein
MKRFLCIALCVCLSSAFVAEASASSVDKLEVIHKFETSGYSVKIAEAINFRDGTRSFLITQGTTGKCGAVYSFPPVKLLHQFSNSDPLGCNPVQVTELGGIFIDKVGVVVTDNGSVIEFSENGQVISTASDPGAVSVAVQPGAPPSASRKGSGATLYVLSDSGVSATVDTIAVAADGTLSAPSLIFTFPTFKYANTITVGPDNAIYGVSTNGGSTQPQCEQAMSGCGFVFRLSPVTANASTTWTLDVLHIFQGGKDGSEPQGPPAFDTSGNLYGATELGGDLTSATSALCTGPQFHTIYGCGVVYMLTKSATYPWHETVLHAFHDRDDGAEPFGPVTLDANGNVFGTTIAGGDVLGASCTSSVLGGRAAGCGTVFELEKPAGEPWQEIVLYAFRGTKGGAQPTGPVSVDDADDVFGATWAGGDTSCTGAQGWAAGCGVLYQLSPIP